MLLSWVCFIGFLRFFKKVIIGCFAVNDFLQSFTKFLFFQGANSYGQLGQGRKCEEIRSPKNVQFDSNASILNDLTNIVVGGNQSFLISNDGTVYGCGLNNVGQLGTVNLEEHSFVRLSILIKYKIIQLSCKWDTCHAVTNDGYCIGWGSNTFGQLGIHPKQVS